MFPGIKTFCYNPAIILIGGFYQDIPSIFKWGGFVYNRAVCLNVSLFSLMVKQALGKGQLRVQFSEEAR
jgi:hypothetical protein